MKVFLAVIYDLLTFTWDLIKNQNEEPTSESEIAHQQNTRSKTITENDLYKTDAVGRNQDKVLNEASTHTVPSVTNTEDYAYVVVKSAKLMKDPIWSFDTALTTYKYGRRVCMLGYERRFARVTYGESSAWILKDEITTNKADVYPTFEDGRVYLAADIEIKKLRKLIKDEFFAEELYLPLQAIEYVSYALKQNNLHIPWTDVRPRLPGKIQHLLKGVRGVHIGIVPKTGSIMEYFSEEDLAEIGYVEAVYPDQSLKFSTVGLEIDGKFTRHNLAKEKWVELRPVFIQVL